MRVLISTLLTLENSTKGKLPKHVATGKRRLTIPQRIVRKLSGPSAYELKEELSERLKLPRFDAFSNAEGMLDVLQHPVVRDADLINLHWAARFVDFKTFFERCNKPVVWTLHDMNAYTGGCHYSMGCEKFTRECFDCPQLLPSSDFDLANANFLIKQRALRPVWKLQIVAPSQWLVDCAGRSALFKPFDRQLIRYGLDVGKCLVNAIASKHARAF